MFFYKFIQYFTGQVEYSELKEIVIHYFNKKIELPGHTVVVIE